MFINVENPISHKYDVENCNIILKANFGQYLHTIFQRVSKINLLNLIYSLYSYRIDHLSNQTFKYLNQESFY